MLKPTKEVIELAQRKSLFRTMWKVMIIDSGITNNLVCTKVIEKLKLKKKKHTTP